MKKTVIIEIISFLLILLFVYAAMSKLFNYSDFKSQLIASPLIRTWAQIIAIVLPVIELITAVMLVVRGFRKYGMIFSIILMTSFTIYIAYMLLFQKHLPCSCGGVLKLMSWKQHLVFNLFFLMLAIAGIFILRIEKTIPSKEYKNIVVQQ
jgi:uncharacterized membrane protein YphA (DoxX/SURF4 family)